MSHTPITDALVESLCPYADGEVTNALECHARRLERDRAELVEALEMCCGLRDVPDMGYATVNARALLARIKGEV